MDSRVRGPQYVFPRRWQQINPPRDLVSRDGLPRLQSVRQLRPHDVLSLVLFSDRAEVFLPPMRVADINRLESQISMVQCGGATEIFRGLEAGYSLLTRYGDSRANRHLVLLTDGHTYGDEAPALNLAERAAQENIATSALGIGSEWNDVFLDRLTSFSGGTEVPR